MFGETVLTHNQRMNMMDFIQEHESGTYFHDQILEDFCWALERMYSDDFRDYGKLGISNPSLHYLDSNYNFLNNFRKITDPDRNNAVFAYAYFDYPVVHSPLYISIIDGENVLPKQVSDSIEDVVRSYGADYKITAQNHYPLTIKINLDEQILYDDYDEDEGDLSYIMRKKREQEKSKSKKDTLMFIHQMLGDTSKYTDNYEKLLSGNEIVPRELFEVIDRSEFSLSELRTYMRGNISSMLIKK